MNENPTKPNDHITKYITEYVERGDAPLYAIMLTGEWGTGKTFFTENLLREIKEKAVKNASYKKHQFEKDRELSKGGKQIYVSLYGMSSFDQIKEEFFRQLFPTLSSKKVTGGLKALKGLINTISVTVSGFKIAPKLPDLYLSGFLTNTKGCLVVFDDLERSNLDLVDLLGFINQYVEHQKLKVIILANEKEILDRAKGDVGADYARIKEKLIGRTFEIKPDFDGALDFFIKNTHPKNLQDFLANQKNTIANIYWIVNYHNIRVLRQSLSDFTRFYELLDDDIRSKEQLMLDLFARFLVYSLGHRSGKMKPEEIIGAYKARSEFDLDVARYLGGRSTSDADSESESIQKPFLDTFSSTEANIPIIDPNLWVEFLVKGNCSKESLQESIRNSYHYNPEKTPEWLKIWNLSVVTEENLQVSLNLIIDELINKKCDEIGDVLHITGILLKLKRIDVFTSMTKQEIFDLANDNIESLIQSGKLPDEIKHTFIHSRDDYKIIKHRNYGFNEIEDNDFLAFLEKVGEMIIAAQNKIDTTDAAADLLELARNDPFAFFKKLYVSTDINYHVNTFPIMQFIDPHEFTQMFLNHSPANRERICKAIANRYDNSSFLGNLYTELGWIESVIAELTARANSDDVSKLTKYQFNDLIDYYFDKRAKQVLENYFSNRAVLNKSFKDHL